MVSSASSPSTQNAYKRQKAKDIANMQKVERTAPGIMETFLKKGGSLAANPSGAVQNPIVSSQYSSAQIQKIISVFKRRRDEIVKRRLQPGREQSLIAGRSDVEREKPPVFNGFNFSSEV